MNQPGGPFKIGDIAVLIAARGITYRDAGVYVGEVCEIIGPLEFVPSTPNYPVLEKSHRVRFTDGREFNIMPKLLRKIDSEGTSRSSDQLATEPGLVVVVAPPRP